MKRYAQFRELRWDKIANARVQAIDTTGAGDSYMAGLLKALHKGNDIKEAMDYGSICGAIAVTKIGAV